MSAEHYDAALERVLLPLEQSPWLGVYAQAADFLATGSGAIADVACGTGRLARLLGLRGEHDYWGVDFSTARIDEARQYVPEATFDVGDLYDQHIRERLGDFDRVVALEILEHIEDDVGVLAAIKPGALVVFSVPNYDSAAHLRTFTSPAAACERYEHLLELKPEHSAVLPRARRPNKQIFILAGRRR